MSTPEEVNFGPLSTTCTRIVGAENRGITVAQLGRLCTFLQSNANDAGWLQWVDIAPRAYSRTAGQRLHWRSINLYQETPLPPFRELNMALSGTRLGDQACNQRSQMQFC